ncbi:MAG: ABC transporter permease [Firmicutes bacterium HGW-Firmicutes-20]|jgi:polar amino acid transport system permease protein|nr:MAG: ABC transporter permease [Firmicutes bacterium HGW-Firmicutes-5]PKM56998.1 MAG: ABC transporter permease [Firmicutes bacterium HGW-Firmicutes-3]PKM64722.1 MAG: ABC transporter permease [Firmicutes bacterium HGW-Firmicutes-20]
MGLFANIITFFTTVVTFVPKFIPGVWLTLQLAFFSIIIGTIIGLFVAVMKLTQNKLLIGIMNIYITIIRGTPLLLQLYFIFYGLPAIGIMLDSFPSAVLGLALHSGAYISEIFRGAIESVDYRQREAARSLGMTSWQATRRIILPQAFKRSIPALGNQFIMAVKDSSLASVITITETMLLARQFGAATYNVFPIFFTAGAYYLIITIILTKLLSKLEIKLKINER